MAVIHFNYKSRAIGMDTNVTLILPTVTREDAAQGRTGYTKDEKFPVLWLLNSGGGDDIEYLGRSYVQQYAEEEKIAVVTLASANSCYQDTMYGQQYFTMLTEELPDLLYSRFPLSPRRCDNAVAGFSMGAAGASWAAARCPEKYGLCVTMSGMADGPEDIAFRMSTGEGQSGTRGGPVLEHIYGPLDAIAGTEYDFNYVLEKSAKKDCGFPIFRMIRGSLDKKIAARMDKYAARLKELGADVGPLEIVEGLAHESALVDIGIYKTLKCWMKEIPGFRS